MSLEKVGGGGLIVVDEGPTNATVYTAGGTVLLESTDPNATLTNDTTGYSVTGGEIVLQDGESLSINTSIQSYLYRTEES
jgi:hypothetical protein